MKVLKNIHMISLNMREIVFIAKPFWSIGVME